jgi:predicted metalloprotease with PDZ domain
VESPAYKAGLGPGMKIVAINRRQFTRDLLHKVIQSSPSDRSSIEMIVDADHYFNTVTLDYHEGERYPHLVRAAGAPDVLDDIIKPMVDLPKK